MQIDNPIRLARELKGAPLSIIYVLSLVHQRVTQEFLERSTGYTDKPVSQALAYLQEIGLVDHTRSGWQLTGEAKQLPLPMALEEEIPSPQPSPCEGEGEYIENDFQLSRNISDSSTTTTESLINLEDESKVVVVDGPSRNFSDLPESSDETIEQNLAEMRRQGIGRNKKTLILARMPHVTPLYIRAHCLKAGPENLGLAITRMLAMETAPPLSSNGHLKDCDCDECARRRYAIICPDCNQYPCVCEDEEEDDV